jgi:16S rRNA C1402 N4-methylase RsmH
MEFFALSISKNYNEQKFLENIKNLMDLTSNGQNLMVFLVSENHIVKKFFLEDVISILNSESLPNLYERDKLIQQRKQRNCYKETKNYRNTSNFFEL